MLTLDEVKNLGLYYVEHADDVYKYCDKASNKLTLVEKGIVLVENCTWCKWYDYGAYAYSKSKMTDYGYNMILVENYSTVLDNVSNIRWYKEGCYIYSYINDVSNDVRYILVENNITIFKDVISCWWYTEGFYVSINDNENYTFDIYYNGELFVKGVTGHNIFSDTQFSFKLFEDGGYTLVNDGKILVDDCKYCFINNSSYLYAKYDDNGNLTETIVELTKDN